MILGFMVVPCCETTVTGTVAGMKLEPTVVRKPISVLAQVIKSECTISYKIPWILLVYSIPSVSRQTWHPVTYARAYLVLTGSIRV